jgi:ankyrin repeat protein
MKIPACLAIALGMIVCFSSAARAANASPERIRGAAAKGVALILSSQKTWHAKQSCYSCHQQALPALALRASREHGISFDEELAGASAVQSFAFLAELDRAIQYTHIIDPAITEGYILAGAHAAGVRPSLTTAVYARFIANRQRVDGHWDSLDVRPPQSYSPFTATTTALHAIQLYGHPSLAADTKARVNRARVWLASNFPHNTEERTMQVLGLSWAGADRVQIDKAAHDLKASQQPDGGWSAIDGLPSEAYSTGEALVALHTAAGVPVADPAWQRGLQFLLSTQEGDGSWHVVSRLHPPAPVSPPYFETGYPYGHDQFISSMGASWAVRALAEALGPARKIEVAELSQAAPKGVEPWMETVLFGSAASLRPLLDKGLDPNAATKSGGTTALMMAMPDLEKTKLLVERGARINARAKTKYSALMVAAQYSGSAPVMRLLLDRGAEVRLPKGAGAPLFNASPFVLAATAGNAEILPRLRGAGDKVDAAMLLLGSFPSTGLQVAVFFGDIATTRAALDCGASIDQPDDDGITPLGWAAIGNQTGVARLLIERGADLNHVDKKGMTPLLYAASIDYGDSAMIDLLVKSGANRNARTKEGQTAAALARQYKHIHLYKSLGAGL